MSESGAARLLSSEEVEHFPDMPAFSSIIGEPLDCSELWKVTGATSGEQTRLKEMFGGIYWDCGGGDIALMKKNKSF